MCVGKEKDVFNITLKLKLWKIPRLPNCQFSQCKAQISKWFLSMTYLDDLATNVTLPS